MKHYLFIRYATKPNKELTKKLFEEVEIKDAKLAVLPNIVISDFKCDKTIEQINEILSDLDITYDIVEVKEPNDGGSQNTNSNDGNERLNHLKQELERAIENAEFELAAELRDEINRIENGEASETENGETENGDDENDDSDGEDAENESFIGSLEQYKYMVKESKLTK